jgi:biopolymer transport protein ExbD
MADISMLLIIFFLVTSRLMNEAHIKVSPPVAQHSKQFRAKEKSVIVDEQGVVYFNGIRTSPAEIRRQLAEAIPTGKTVPADDRTVTVKCDSKLAYEKLIEVLAPVAETGALVVVSTEAKAPEKK